MIKDYRMSFIQTVETALVGLLSIDQINLVSNVVTKALSDYEITARCTDLVVSDDRSEKLIKRYRACLLVDGKSEKTVYAYTRTLKHFRDVIQKPLTDVNAYDVRFFLAMEQERGISARSRENTRANLSAFFQWLTNEELIPKNPILKLKPIKCPDEIRLPFSEVEIDAIRSACRDLKDRAIVEMLLSTGVRVSELVHMKVQDISLVDLSVHVAHGKGNKERMTYTTGVSANHLKKYLLNREESGPNLFYNKKHNALKAGGIRYILNQIADRAGVKNVHPHRFRRTFATGLAKRGMDIQEIQRLLGHSHVNTTMDYISVDDVKVQASYRQYIV